MRKRLYMRLKFGRICGKKIHGICKTFAYTTIEQTHKCVNYQPIFYYATILQSKSRNLIRIFFAYGSSFRSLLRNIRICDCNPKCGLHAVKKAHNFGMCELFSALYMLPNLALFGINFSHMRGSSNKFLLGTSSFNKNPQFFCIMNRNGFILGFDCFRINYALINIILSNASQWNKLKYITQPYTTNLSFLILLPISFNLQDP